MTTPPNHNTADQSGAMQPTSSASSADLAALFKELSNCYVIRYGRKTTIELPYDLYDRILAATRNESAIVPQVVQAPSNGAVKTATKVFQSIFFNVGLDGESAYEQMQRAMRAAIISSEYVAAPIVATPKLTECRHCGFMVALNQAPADAAPIVATVPSEQKPIAWVRLRSDGCYEGPLMDSSRDMCDIRRRSGAWTPLYAAPSPTEQASDVLEQLLQLCETERIDQRDMACCDTCSGLTYNDALADLAKKVRALSAPAAKGNAQDEVKPIYTTGHCEYKKQPGGCPHHNLQCGYPSCDRKDVK